jgi:aminopeptidase N
MKLQVNLITILYCAILSAAVPVKDGFLELGSIISSNQISPAEVGYRLPNTSIPLRYDLWLQTDVDKAVFDFSGRVKIHVRIVEATQSVTLNQRQITVEQVDFIDLDHSVTVSNVNFVFLENVELMVITLPRVVEANEEIVLDIMYTGKLRYDNAGFHRDSYESDDGEVWLAATNFRATDARHALPCYDEPSFMAIFNVEIQHDKSYMAISNTRLASIEQVAESDYVVSKFHDTPLMSTHVLSFVISNYAFVSNTNSITEQRVYGPPQSITDGSGDFAIGIVDEILRSLEEHFGDDLTSLSKIDHVALVNLRVGAVENVGLITYREEYLLNFNQSNSKYGERITETIVHNVVHQWFSGLVTPAWWSYAWLNEAFATLYQYIIPDLISGNSYDDRLDRELQMGFVSDTWTSLASVPLNSYVESPDEIASKFGYISHQKGAAVLRMFREVLTPATFTKGVGYYLKAMKNAPATPRDLHRELQRAFDEDFPENNINLDAVMRTWEDQAGYPVIEVEKYGDKFILTQWRYEYGDEIYSIPISFATKSEPTFDRRTPKLIMETKTVEIQIENPYDWIILNIDTTGFFQVSYDKNIWKALIDQLKADHEVISAFHRRQLFRDLNDILGDPYTKFDYIYILEMLSYLSKETENSVWYYSPQTTFKYKLFGTSAYEKYCEFQHSLVNPHLRRLGFEPIEGESANDAGLRKTTAAIACDSYELRCLTFELGRIKQFVETGEGEFNMCHGLRLADEPIHSLFVGYLFAEDSPFYRKDLIDSLGCSLDNFVLRSYLELTLDPTNNLTIDERDLILGRTAFSSQKGLDVSLDFLTDHVGEIVEK